MAPTPPRPPKRRRRTNLERLSAPVIHPESAIHTPRRRRPGSYGRPRRPPLGDLSLSDGAAEQQEVSLGAERARHPVRTCI